MMTIPIQSISRLLPQTQCRECGYEGCLPYARALSAGEAPVNLCAPGGETVMKDIADLLGKPYLAPAKTQIKAVALIDEAVCIGCTACIRACPVDAIMGASKLMHTVISDECTGCGLCVTPCPVDCIDMVPVSQPFLPSARRFSTSAEPRFAAAEHAQSRFERHTARKQRDDAERKALLAQREAAVKAKQAAQAQTAAPSAALPNTATKPKKPPPSNFCAVTKPSRKRPKKPADFQNNKPIPTASGRLKTLHENQ